ncbi:MAG: hypothetical protein HQ474_02425 [Flammeovirgaceae bacterium]|jgi:N-dimethylarginine dimethylaminohydrolase|nr:hypothetical protein [Flammeovirgaceae bacterium]
MTKLTAHSEYGMIHSLLIKSATQAFRSEEYLMSQWRQLNYLALPDFKKSLQEYEEFVQLLQMSCSMLHQMPASDDVKIDSIYCRDAAISTNGGMIICRMGKIGRANEPAQEKRFFEEKGINILGEISAPGTLEGGDVAWLDEHTLAVGHTYRTNEAGIEQLKVLLKPLDVEVIVSEMPHYNGPQDVFHLMSVLSPIDRNLAVVYSRLMPIKFRNELLNRGFELIEVPDGEFDSMGCNVLAIAPRKVLMVAGNPVTQTRLGNVGVSVFTYQGSEISVKGGGGPTCLTRPILRTHE